MQDWLEVVNRGYKGKERLPLLLVGAKTDLVDKKVVPTEEAQQAAKDNDFEGFMECSSKSGDKVNDVFAAITEIILKKQGIL